MKVRDLIKALEGAGYRLHRNGSEHDIYVKKGARPIPVPRHREINENTAQTILKQAGIQ